jgi:hypothetical protein
VLSLRRAPSTQGVDSDFEKVLFRAMCEPDESQTLPAFGRTLKLFPDPCQNIAASNPARVSFIDRLLQHGKLHLFLAFVVL